MSETEPFPVAVVDAFTSVPFRGNPAAICLLPSDHTIPDAWMSSVAAEMNLSETAFVWKLPNEVEWALRWFTPNTEVDLCGHATLATAHYLWETQRVSADAIQRFSTRSGMLAASKCDQGVQINLPETSVLRREMVATLDEILGTKIGELWQAGPDWLVEMESLDSLVSLSPKFDALARMPIRGVIVTTRSPSSDFDFASRFFAPSVGIPEDPVTGSAHCALAPFWSTRLGLRRLRARQVSPRGGELVCECLPGHRISLEGQAVTVWSGRLSPKSLPSTDAKKLGSSTIKAMRLEPK